MIYKKDAQKYASRKNIPDENARKRGSREEWVITRVTLFVGFPYSVRKNTHTRRSRLDM